MIKKAFQLGLTSFLLVQSQAQESAPKAEVVELRATISKMVDVKARTSAELSEWETRKETMSELLELHQKELALLNEELELAGQSAKPFDEKKQEAQTAVEELKKLRQETSAVVTSEREKALRIIKMLPEPLKEELFLEIDKVKTWRPGDEPRVALQAILEVVSRAVQFNRRVTMGSEERGGEEVTVIYLGLARGYYVSPSGKAGVGDVTAEGWKWSERSELARTVQNAVDQLHEKRPPELVKLPLKVASKEVSQ